ncbi:MAG: succinate dehydrogenase, cytochrome b556 subunit [Rhodobiaceae bacterium]|nr:succinate dehydrogenase, cytochrome b556 subunit [Rhodobiaceae bacterium]MCC0055563.1 succinate dehydrogenase, cytochrome b556 subunit [Rhodobiaceae bacterium]
MASTERPSRTLASERPLSPHLSIYKPYVTMVTSIMHRATGIVLYAGTLLLVWWLVAAATGPSYFDFVNGLAGSWIGRLVLFGYTWALMHHMLGGIRHIVWDLGYGFTPAKANTLAWANIAGSIILTLLIWIAGYAAMGN